MKKDIIPYNIIAISIKMILDLTKNCKNRNDVYRKSANVPHWEKPTSCDSYEAALARGTVLHPQEQSYIGSY